MKQLLKLQVQGCCVGYETTFVPISIRKRLTFENILKGKGKAVP
jgi:hypothetical protein